MQTGCAALRNMDAAQFRIRTSGAVEELTTTFAHMKARLIKDGEDGDIRYGDSANNGRVSGLAELSSKIGMWKSHAGGRVGYKPPSLKKAGRIAGHLSPAALDNLAILAGFQSWKHLQKALKGKAGANENYEE